MQACDNDMLKIPQAYPFYPIFLPVFNYDRFPKLSWILFFKVAKMKNGKVKYQPKFFE